MSARPPYHPEYRTFRKPWLGALLTCGTAVAEAPPKVTRRLTIEPSLRTLRRTLAIRHVSGHRLVAMVEVFSPANKDREETVVEFAEKVEAALKARVHVPLVDLFPPGSHDPEGMHGVIWHHLDGSNKPYDLPADAPLTLASYVAAPPVVAYLEHVALDTALTETPLFLHPERYVNVPLEATYRDAFAGMPAFWRDVLEARPARAN